MKYFMENIIETCIDKSSSHLKKTYVYCLLGVKWILKKCGILAYLDQKVHVDRKLHYIRSLFATHQLDDMLFLDVPWWTYGAIDEIKHYLLNVNKQATVFEYGSGASTVWLAKRCNKLIAVEHDVIWFEKLQPKLQDFTNITLCLKPPGTFEDISLYTSEKIQNVNFKEYVLTIEKTSEKFDLIIIDGRCRVACFENALKHLKPNGMILLDNSNRKRYQSLLNAIQFKKKVFRGPVPGSPFYSETTVFYS